MKTNSYPVETSDSEADDYFCGCEDPECNVCDNVYDGPDADEDSDVYEESDDEGDDDPYVDYEIVYDPNGPNYDDIDDEDDSEDEDEGA